MVELSPGASDEGGPDEGPDDVELDLLDQSSAEFRLGDFSNSVSGHREL